MIFIIAVCFYCRVDLLLMSIGILEDTSINAHKTILLMIPGMFIQAFNENFKNYLISIGATTPFFYLNIVLICLYPFLGYLFLWVIGVGIQGYGAIIFIRELVSFIVLTIYLSKVENQEHNFMLRKNRIHFKDVFSGMGEYLCSYAKMFGTIFIPYMGWELNTFFIGMLKSNSYQAAWASTQSINNVTYCVGGGCGQTARTAVSNLIGKELNHKAKEYAIKSTIANLTISVICG